jgi:hypothetical protein
MTLLRVAVCYSSTRRRLTKLSFLTRMLSLDCNAQILSPAKILFIPVPNLRKGEKISESFRLISE